jgi:hypothetical protein
MLVRLAEALLKPALALINNLHIKKILNGVTIYFHMLHYYFKSKFLLCLAKGPLFPPSFSVNVF